MLNASPTQVRCYFSYTENGARLTSYFIGVGCTYLQYDGGYQTDKAQRSDWKAYSGSFRASKDVPPLTMFNMIAAPKARNVTQRTDLYQVTTKRFPAGAGQLSFSPADTNATEAGYLFYDNEQIAGATATATSNLSFSDDFTLEGFFRAYPNGHPETAGTKESRIMTILKQQDDGTGFCYTVYLNGSSFVFAVQGTVTGSANETIKVEMGNSTVSYSDGRWYYFATRFDQQASGIGTKSMLSVKLLSSANEITIGSAFTSVNFTISTSPHDLTIGRTKLQCSPTPSPNIDCEWFNGRLDELRFSKGLVVDQDLLGKVGAAYWTISGNKMVSSTPSACQKLVKLTAQKGVISDGTSKGQEYPNGQVCDWLIDQSDLSNGATDESALTFIALSFTRFSTEPGGDVVRVYDGSTQNAPLLGELSGYDVPAYVPLISSGNTMLVRFVTDSRQLGPQDG